jgi:hypothetical protein
VIDLNPATLQLYASGAYKDPNHLEVRAVVEQLGMTADQVADLVGVATGRTVRRWLAAPGTKNTATIDYAAWRLMLLEAEIVRPRKRRPHPAASMSQIKGD